MIVNGIICEGCNEELQLIDFVVGVNDKNQLVRVCGLCEHEHVVEEQEAQTR